MNRRVVVTGLGAITPIGNNVPEFWSAVKQQKVGIGEITHFDATDYKCHLAAEVKDFDAKEYMDFRSAKRMEAFCQFAVAAAGEALEDSGLSMEAEDAYRVGTSISSGVGSLQAIEREHSKLLEKGPGRVNPLFVPMMISNMAAGNVSIQFGLKGKSLNISTACASGTNAIGEAFRTIQYGDAEVMVAGGTESCITPLGIAGFTVLLALFAASPLGMIAPEHAEDSVIALTGWAVVEGILKAVFPILIIILMAIYSYNILVESRQIEVIKRQFTSITDDKGLLVLLLVWGFGGLLEGMAGFGTAVAIPAAILIGLGFKPMFSALVSLIGNTVATGFGAVGVPVTTLCNEVAESGSASAAQICETSAFAIIQLAPLFIILPFIILTLTDKHNLIKNLIIALWVGVISVVVQFVCGYYLGSETPAIIGSLAAIIAIIAYAKVFARKSKVQDKETFTLGESLKAWSVYLFILIFILVSGALCPPVNAFLKSHLVSAVHLPVLDSTFKFGWISNAGLMLFLGATIGGLIQGLSLKRLMVILARTTVNLRKTVVTICSLIALASVMNYSGMITSIASGLVAVTGDFYPLVAPMIGAIGTFVTGSDTSSNILFAKLQAHVANQLGMTGQSTFFGMEGGQENWLVAANTTGATGGKMISPQSIAIATAACDMEGKDGEILRSAIPYALLYIVLGGLMVYFGC